MGTPFQQSLSRLVWAWLRHALKIAPNCQPRWLSPQARMPPFPLSGMFAKHNPDFLRPTFPISASPLMHPASGIV